MKRPDIINETLRFFRINVLFKNFEINGYADVLLFYLTVFTQYCLKKLRKMCLIVVFIDFLRKD
jgi:actin related protein 2/3 complex subunit 3